MNCVFLATFGVNEQRPAELEDVADVTRQPPAGTNTGHTRLGGAGQDAATMVIDRSITQFHSDFQFRNI